MKYFLQPLLEETKVLSSLTMIFSNNVMGFAGGRLGAVNGMLEGGGVDRREIYPGFALSLIGPDSRSIKTEF